MPSWITYLVILVVFAVTVYWLQTADKKLEGFEGDASATSTTTETSDKPAADAKADDGASDIVKPYIENLDSLPGAATIKYYLSSFSAGTKYDSGFAPFRANETKWYDLFNRNTNFLLIGMLPSMTVLNTGLPMKGIKMVGPPSEELGGVSSYELPPFTYMLYGKMNSIVFENKQPITLFQLYAENPNHISLVLYPQDSVMVKVELTLGNVNRVYQWSIPRSTLLSNGNKTLYTLVYEKLESGTKAYFYIGDNQYSATITNPSAIKLGNSPMDVNSDANLDMTLWNMGVLTSALTREEVKRWSDYFNVQSSGLAGNLDVALSAFDAIAQDAVKQIALQEENVKSLEDELSKCKAALPSAESLLENAKSKWHISLDGVVNNSTVTGEESASCSILKLAKNKTDGTNGATAGTGSGTGTTAGTGATTGTGTTTGTGATTGTGTTTTSTQAQAQDSAVQSLLSRFHIRLPGSENTEPKATADKFTNPARK